MSYYHLRHALEHRYTSNVRTASEATLIFSINSHASIRSVLSDYLELAPIGKTCTIGIVQLLTPLPFVVILYYDHLITLSTEISHMWSCPPSKPSMLFFLHRYVQFIGHIAVLIYALGNLVPGEKVGLQVPKCPCDIFKPMLLIPFSLRRGTTSITQNLNSGYDVSCHSCQAYILFHQFLLAFNQAMVAGK